MKEKVRERQQKRECRIKSGAAVGTKEEEHLGQVVDDEGEKENHNGVEKQFGQTKQRAPRFQSRLQK